MCAVSCVCVGHAWGIAFCVLSSVWQNLDSLARELSCSQDGLQSRKMHGPFSTSYIEFVFKLQLRHSNDSACCTYTCCCCAACSMTFNENCELDGLPAHLLYMGKQPGSAPYFLHHLSDYVVDACKAIKQNHQPASRSDVYRPSGS